MRPRIFPTRADHSEVSRKRTARRLERCFVATSVACVVAACGGAKSPPSEEEAPSRGGRPVEVHGSAVAFADSAVADWVDRAVVSGAVLRVSTGEGVLLERAYGWAQAYDYGNGQYQRWDDPTFGVGPGGTGLEPLPEPRPMTPETRFDLASVTKVMATTFALMMLVDQEQVDLDRPVAVWWPAVAASGKGTITPRHLLTHTAGLPQWQPTYHDANRAEEALDLVLEYPLSWSVGGERHYSDLGFMLLGGLVEVVTGRGLDLFLQEDLYGPLGLTHTGFGPSEAGPFAATSHGNPFEYRMVHDSTFGYRIAGDPERWDGWRRHTLVGEVNDGNAHHAFGGVAGHAGLFSTAEELDVLVRLLLDGGLHDGESLISRGVVEEFLTPHVAGQALGWQVPEGAPPGSFAHTGFTGTWVLGVPALDLSVILLTNRQHGGVDGDARYPDLDPLRRAILERFSVE